MVKEKQRRSNILDEVVFFSRSCFAFYFEVQWWMELEQIDRVIERQVVYCG